jgi:hypothetical protein
MADEPSARDLERMIEVLQLFAEAEGGRIVGARVMEDIEGTTTSEYIDLPVTVERGSTVLGAALRAAGIMPPSTSYHAHHIVPRGMKGAQRARDILEAADIGIDTALKRDLVARKLESPQR